MGRAAEALDVSEGQREVLDTLAGSQTLPIRVVQRARALLLATDGVSNVEIAELVGVSRPTVLRGGPTSRSHAWSRSARAAPAGAANRPFPPRRTSRVASRTLTTRR